MWSSALDPDPGHKSAFISLRKTDIRIFNFLHSPLSYHHSALRCLYYLDMRQRALFFVLLLHTVAAVGGLDSANVVRCAGWRCVVHCLQPKTSKVTVQRSLPRYAPHPFSRRLRDPTQHKPDSWQHRRFSSLPAPVVLILHLYVCFPLLYCCCIARSWPCILRSISLTGYKNPVSAPRHFAAALVIFRAQRHRTQTRRGATGF